MPPRNRTTEAQQTLAILRQRVEAAQAAYHEAEVLFTQRGAIDAKLEALLDDQGLKSWVEPEEPKEDKAWVAKHQPKTVEVEHTHDPRFDQPAIVKATADPTEEELDGILAEYTPSNTEPKHGGVRTPGVGPRAGEWGRRNQANQAKKADAALPPPSPEITIMAPDTTPTPSEAPQVKCDAPEVKTHVPPLKPSVLAYACSNKKVVSILLSGEIAQRLGDSESDAEVQETMYGDGAEEVCAAADEAQALAAQAGSLGLRGSVTLVQDLGSKAGVINLWGARFS